MNNDVINEIVETSPLDVNQLTRASENIIDINIVNQLLSEDGETNETTSAELQDAIQRQQEISDSYSSLNSGTFLGVVFVAVLISMIFESGLKFMKKRIDTNKEEGKEYTNYKKAMIITLALYAIFLVIFFLVVRISIGFPTEIIIALEIASVCMVLVSTFFKFSMLLPKKKN